MDFLPIILFFLSSNLWRYSVLFLDEAGDVIRGQGLGIEVIQIHVIQGKISSRRGKKIEYPGLINRKKIILSPGDSPHYGTSPKKLFCENAHKCAQVPYKT